MQLLKRQRTELQEASKRLTCALFDSGYISEQDKEWLIYRLKTGDRTACSDLKELLVEIAEEIGRT